MELEETSDEIALPIYQSNITPHRSEAWELAQELYVQEHPLIEISQRTGIPVNSIRQKAHVQRWNQLIELAQNELLASLSRKWSANITESLIRDSEAWKNRETPDSPKDIRDYEQARLTHINAARLVLGIEKRERQEQGADSALLIVGTGSDVSARRIKRVSRGRPSKQDAAIDVDSSSSPTSTPTPGA